MAEEKGMDDKTIAIISHITIIGWIVALVMNSSNKSEHTSFYLRQMLGLMIIAIAGSIISFVGMAISILALVLWILSLISAASGEKKEVPVVGAYFQDWFKGL